VPGTVEAATATASVEPAPAVTDAGVNEAVAPAGSPVAENVIVWAAPLVTAVEMEYDALPPCCAELEEGLIAIEKVFRAKAPFTVIAPLAVNEQVVVELVQEPPKPPKLDPESGVAVKVT
jgi:hypothetical protein